MGHTGTGVERMWLSKLWMSMRSVSYIFAFERVAAAKEKEGCSM